MLYSTVLGAAIMFVLGLLLLAVTVGLALPFLAIGCAVWADIAMSGYNRQLSQMGRVGTVPRPGTAGALPEQLPIRSRSR